MARRAFFSFHYQRDIWRVNQVRNSWVVQPGIQQAVWYDASLWEEAKTKGNTALKNLIDDGLKNTSVTVVLIGTETYKREWVKYEIEQSFVREKGLIGIYIHGLKNVLGQTDIKGENPFSTISLETNNQKTYFSNLYPTYDWILNEGYKNIASWIEEAAKRAGR
ncbi:MAG: TIR domain-containing protein [Nostoc sp. NMS7]|uniref:TIR domain-containing protein n=1 Tax=Nostoc sp. NMS7 TaxID=2815391 RepID=UPI0025FE2886|nr:TIR domain-containing protein [Nostoc sp. NMS7]MBN3948816.1 TIR domain-containing protein [Nostoc sp. NMS7]